MEGKCLYDALKNLNVEVNEISYTFALSMLGKVQELFKGKLAMANAAKHLLEVLFENLDEYKSFFKRASKLGEDVRVKKGSKSLPISCIYEILNDESKEKLLIDRVRKNFKAIEGELKKSLEDYTNKTGDVFRADLLERAFVCYADFHTLLTEMYKNESFVTKVYKTDYPYEKKLELLAEEFIEGIKKLEQNRMPNMERKKTKMNKAIHLLTVENIYDALLDTLPWFLADTVELEDVEAFFKEKYYIADTAIQKLTFKLSEQDLGGVIFFKTVAEKFIIAHICSVAGRAVIDGLYVDLYSTKQQFVTALAELLNEWNPDLEATAEEADFTTSTKDDIENSIASIIRL